MEKVILRAAARPISFFVMETRERDPLTYAIIGAAIEVHRNLGPGILESACEECFCFELVERGFSVRRQVLLPLVYRGRQIEFGYRPDLIIDDAVMIELKCVEKLLPVHDAQILTYMRLAEIERGLLINFQSQPLISGIKRFVRSRTNNSEVSAVSAVSASTSSRERETNSRQGKISPASESCPV